MATKKKDESPNTITNVNTNNNTNHINVNVKLDQPKRVSKTVTLSKPKPNWVVKAIVMGIIGLALSILGFYIKNQLTEGKGNTHEVKNGTAPITGTRAN